jgi:hypothetical protein
MMERDETILPTIPQIALFAFSDGVWTRQYMRYPVLESHHGIRYPTRGPEKDTFLRNPLLKSAFKMHGIIALDSCLRCAERLLGGRILHHEKPFLDR